MKKKRLFQFVACLLSGMVLSFGACTAPEEPPKNDTVNVIVVENGGAFSAGNNVYTVTRGEDLYVPISIDEEFEFSACNYPDYFLTEIDGTNYLVLRNVRFATRIDVSLTSRFVTVSLKGNTNCIIGEDTFVLLKGEDLTVEFTLEDGFEFTGCSYDNYRYTAVDGKVILTLLDVRKNVDLKISTVYVEREIVYHANGGTLEGGADSFSVELTSDALRINTEFAGSLKRDGYTMTGWNTSPDGTGEHIGMGSRITVRASQTIHLYAEWSKWLDGGYFSYDVENGNATITGYVGAAVDEFVIPEEIDGYKVTKIMPSAVGPLLQGSRIEKLVLPRMLSWIVRDSFVDCTIKEVYLFDNFQYVDDDSFEGCTLTTMHINADRKPCLREEETARFADALDRVILNPDRQKMIFFAGCSMSHGLNSKVVEQHYGNKYVVCNYGFVGETNTPFQLDVITHYLGEGDVFIQAPEYGSPNQFMHETEADSRMFTMVEGNFDLLALADLSKIEHVWRSFSAFQSLRELYDEDEYTDRCEDFDEYGDYIPYIEDYEEDHFVEPCDIDVGFLSDEAVYRMIEYYSAMERQGINVLFSYAPLNESSLTQAQRESNVVGEFETRYKETVGSRFLIISEMATYTYNGMYFWDTDYHLTTTGVLIRTLSLLEDLDRTGLL